MAGGGAVLLVALALAGAGSAFYLYIVNPGLPAVLREKLSFIVRILDDKYGFDRFFGFSLGDARPVDHFIDNVEFDQIRLPPANSMIGLGLSFVKEKPQNPASCLRSPRFKQCLLTRPKGCA